jgi:hypothetical protein
MPRHVWTVLCESSVTDTQTNRLSLFNTLEQVAISVPPEDLPVNLPVRFEIVTHWMRSDIEVPEEARARIVIYDPNTEKEELDPYKINLTEAFKRFRQQNRFFGLEVHGSGIIWFTVELETGDGWEEVARVPLEVELQSEDT